MLKLSLALVNLSRSKHLDGVFRLLFISCTLTTLLILAGIILGLGFGAWPAFKVFGFSFIVNADWNPPAGIFGALAMIYGTLITSAIALIIAVPISLGIAIFLTELAPQWLRQPMGIMIELLAAIPSIVYGMWGLFIFSPIMADYLQTPLQNLIGETAFLSTLIDGPALGIGVLPAGIILSIMIIPFIATVMRDVFLITPDVLKESAYALGATTWEVVRNVVLPYTKAGVIGGIILGLGRALGETMAVTFIIGNINQLEFSLFSPGNSITSALANEIAEADPGLHTSSLMYLGLILFCITFAILICSKLLLLKVRKR